MAWTLTLHATAYEADDDAISGLQLALVSFAPDTLAFTFRAAIDASLPFAVGQAALLVQDAATRFRGRIEAIDPVASGSSEELRINCVGPWSYLERIVYEQTWQVGNGTDDTLGNQSKTRVIVGQDDAGAKRSVGAEITAAVAYAVAQGAALSLSTVTMTTTLHYQELVDVTCAELIRSVLRYLPDALSWFDYSTSTPTLHIARRADLSSVSIAAGDCDQFSVRSRPDLQAAGVVLYFESTYQYNDSVYPRVTSQTAGTTTGEKVIKATIALDGAGMTEERQRLKVLSISLTSASFWNALVPALQGVSSGDLTVSSSGSTEEVIYSGDSIVTPLGNFLLEGSISEWMGINARKVTAKAKIKYTGGDADTKARLGDNEDRWYSLAGISTTGSTKTYRRVTSAWAGESAPSGLATAMYAAMGVLHYEGQATLADTECDFSVRPGLLLNITGGRSEWSTMVAAIQAVTHALDSGSTTVQFGPAQQLSPQAFVEMLRGNRTARTTWRVTERTGTATAAALNRGGEVQPKNDSQQIGGMPAGYEETAVELCDPDDPEADPIPGKIWFKPD